MASGGGSDGDDETSWHVFLSHVQGSGGDQCRQIQLALEQRGLRVWYDNTAAVVTAAGMKAGVRGSGVFLLFLSKGVFTRPFVRLEIAEALLLNKPICLVHEEDHRHGKFDFASEATVKGVPVEWQPVVQLLLQECESLPFRRKEYEFQALMRQIEAKCAKPAVLVVAVPDALLPVLLSPAKSQQGGGGAALDDEWEIRRSLIDLGDPEVVLGRGAQADVLKATLSLRGEKFVVAVKRLRATTAAERVAALRLLARELRALRRVKHKNVIGLHGVCTSEGGEPLVLMSFAAGGTLTDMLEGGGDQIDSEKRFRLLEGIAQGLRMIHACELLHLDIKPANVLIAEDGTPWLTDFGISKSVSTAAKTKGAAGTRSYMPPERFRSRRKGGSLKTKAADVFAFAILAWEVLTGQSPPWGADADDEEITESIKEGERPEMEGGGVGDWRESPHIVATGMAELIERMWAQEHEDRPTIEKVCDELSALGAARFGKPADQIAADASAARVHASVVTAQYNDLAAKLAALQSLTDDQANELRQARVTAA